MGRSLAAVAACLLLLAGSGCGAPEGVEEGATVSAYVDAALCPEARRALAAAGGGAGNVRVRAVCVNGAERGRGSRLAAIGAAARRASEDSTSVAYLGAADPVAMRFSRPILGEAGIARISSSSGTMAMGKLLRAIRDSEDSGLRESVYEQLG